MVSTINTIITNGITFDVKNWQTPAMTMNHLQDDINHLFNALDKLQLNYLLVGGIALLSYVEGRNTQDIDLILSRQDLIKLSGIQIIEENKNFIRGKYQQLQVDILLTQNKLFKTVLKDFTAERKFGNQLIHCVTVEGLIVLKLYALPSLYRQGKFDKASIYENDILLLLLQYTVNLTPLLTLLSKHLLASDLEEVDVIINDIQAKIHRFSQHKQRFNPDAEK
ncbi:MAG: hypothetical protein VKL20_03540 [Synechocystis sp.]|nr:hypothetical protein [Synechocystis sp.]